jgi:hypothetical protein
VGSAGCSDSSYPYPYAERQESTTVAPSALGSTARAPSGPTSVCVWGMERERVSQTGLAIGRALAPRYYWLDLRGPEGGAATPVPRSIPSSEETSGVAIPAEALAPNWALGDLRHWTVVVEPTGSPEAERLADHARLPELLRHLIERQLPGAGPAALVVTNVDLGADRLYPSEPGTFSRGIASMARAGISLVVTLGRAPRANMEDFSHEFRVDEGGPAGEALVTCRRAREGFGPPFESDQSWGFGEFETLLRARSARSTEHAT